MEQKVSTLNHYFEEQIAACEQLRSALLADERTDEATFEKVKANIYDIFRTVLSAAVKNCGNDPDAVHHFFVQRMEQIPTSWSVAYEKAKQHHDVSRMHLEQIKLDTIDKIRESFTRIWEGAQ